MIQVKLTDKVVTAEVVKQNAKTVWVRLADGNVIKRNIAKHVIEK